ncbi:MAG: amidohydrolase family protein [Acidobacteria bacterium]|nr:amidohydrolase family protein [Acidobacteriota bacterium]
MVRRRWALMLVMTLGLALGTCALLPAQPPKPLSPEARALIAKAMEGLDPALPLVDHHTHLIGNGKGASGIEVNPVMRSWLHPKKRLMTSAYLGGVGLPDDAHFDEAYLARLAEMAKAFGRPVRIHLLALDRNHRPDGTVDGENTEFYVPNDAVLKAAEAHPGLFVPVVSIHPARPDALQELDRCADRGARFLKWLPNAQNIDPADPRYDAFYRRMAERHITLLTHAGEEKAVTIAGAQAMGNPLKLRRPLDLGVRVIIAHGASLGMNEDLDHPGAQASNFDLFTRLLDEPNYEGRLYADLSAITQANRMPGPLTSILEHPEWARRFVNGSDFPLPAIDLVIWTRSFAKQGFITKAERKALNEIWKVNPLLFDFVLKRTLRHPKTGAQLPAACFGSLR